MPALTVKLNDMSPFIQFLKRSTGSSSIPDFAVLAGNPSAPGRRFVFLVLPRQGYPTVIKAGIGPEARQLIAREADVLRQKRVEMPKLIDFDPGEDSGVAALAMEHVSGRPPGERDSPASLLKGWLLDGDLVQLNRWCPGLPSSASAKPALFHGDFTPWNALITPDGFWKALDWERGQLTGPPAWDWFHYVLQPALLVNRLNADDLEGLLRVLLESPEFAGYAEIAGISKYLREVLLSYLDHSLEIARQTEGREQLNSLRHRIRTQWKSGSAF